MSPLQPPNHCACDPAAILSICVASAGREVRHESAVCFAFEFGFTQNVAPAIGFPVTGTGGGLGSGVGGGGGLGVGPGVGAGVGVESGGGVRLVPPFFFLAPD